MNGKSYANGRIDLVYITPGVYIRYGGVIPMNHGKHACHQGSCGRDSWWMAVGGNIERTRKLTRAGELLL